MVLGMILTLYFILGVRKSLRGYYFRNLSEPFFVCPRRFYDPNDMDEVFADCKSVNRASTFKMKNVGELLNAVFHFGAGFEWRLAKPHERIYHRPDGVWFGVTLEQLRAGLRPKCHHFIKALCRQKLNIPITQIVPNDVRWLNWFIACCTRSKIEPTFRIFFTFFIIQKSTLSPLYEIHFKSEFCAEKPVRHLKSLKGWHPEFIFIKGGDLLDMPNFSLLALLEKVNQSYIDKVIDHDLLADQLLVVANAGSRKKKQRVRNPDALVSVGGSASFSSPEHQSIHGRQEDVIEVDDVAEVESGRHARGRTGPLVRIPRSRENHMVGVPPSGGSRSVVTSTFAHGSSSHAGGSSKDPDAGKVGWLFGNYESDYLDFVPTADDLERLESLDYTKQAKVVQRSFGAFATFFGNFHKLSLREHEKFEVSENAAHEVVKYKKDLASAKLAMKATKGENTSLQQRVLVLEKSANAKDKEMEDLRVAMGRLSGDVIDTYMKSDDFNKTVTKEAAKIIPKAFWTSKKFLREKPQGLLPDFVPYFLQTPDDIEDPDEDDEEEEEGEIPCDVDDVDDPGAMHVPDTEMVDRPEY
ncbi:hypothetical protein POM88_013976 [Heracleum sosnowskyi]|uniref:Uncharacterized protein n=1 Tax=Heracleum sosnowskyi TaxID=360622 RepID=A0AAD8MYM0_9APIA|nr:hypothetical protein POM88_013976 [Heracleum sosnowskyi]